MARHADTINHKEFITYKEFLSYFTDFREIEDRNKSKSQLLEKSKKEL